MVEKGEQKSIFGLSGLVPCAKCGAKFHKKYYNQEYCTTTCQQDMTKVVHEKAKGNLKSLKKKNTHTVKPRSGKLSYRQQRVFDILIDYQPHTSWDLAITTGFPTPRDIVRDLRDKGYEIRTDCLGENENGYKVYTFTLLTF